MTPVSWRLWNCLRHPPEHPLYWRVIKLYRVSGIWRVLLTVVVLGYSFSSFLAQYALPLPIILFTILTIISVGASAVWIGAAAHAIASERYRATYSLICATPNGAAGANWAIVTAVLHHRDLFNWVDGIRRLFSASMLLLLLMALLPISISKPTNFYLILLEIFIFTAYSYIEYTQSVVLGMLIAVMVPQYVRDSGFWSVLVFVALQVAVIVFSLVVTVYLHKAIFIIVLLYILREITITTIWKVVSSQILN